MSFPWDFSKPPPGYPSVPPPPPTQSSDYSANPYYNYHTYQGFETTGYNENFTDPYYSTEYKTIPPPPGTSKSENSSHTSNYKRRSDREGPSNENKRDREGYDRDVERSKYSRDKRTS